VEITVTLLIIVGFLAGLAWFAKRLRGGFKPGGARIQVLGAQALGPKERAVLVRVGDTDILVGVAANSVNTLHVFPAGAITAPAEAEPAAPNAPNFKALLLKSLGLKGQG
jgi:flagellar protein FliO/FliZ